MPDFEILARDPLISTMCHPGHSVSNQMDEFINSIQMVSKQDF